MKTIGLIGGIASGKSLVAAELVRLGAEILDADRAAHAALREPQIREAVVRRFGPQVLEVSGEVDRDALAQRVFAPPPAGHADRRFLEKLVHPWVEEALRKEAAKMAARGAAAAVVDAPLLLEAGWDNWCDAILFVEAPPEVRARRAAKRGWSDEEFRAREATQASLEVKRARADAIIDNSGTILCARAQIERLWDALIVHG